MPGRTGTYSPAGRRTTLESEEVGLMLQPIVVGLDGSRESVAAADWAAREALRRGLPLRLIHAWEGPPEPAESTGEVRS